MAKKYTVKKVGRGFVVHEGNRAISRRLGWERSTRLADELV